MAWPLTSAPGSGRDRRLAGELSLAMALVVLLVSALVAGAGYAYTSQAGWRTLESKADECALSLQSSLEAPVWAFDDDTVTKVAQSFLNNDLLASLAVTDPEGKVIFARSLPAEPTALERTVSLRHGGSLIGRVRFSLSAKQYLESRRTLLWMSLWTGLAVLVTLWWLTGWALNRLLRRPLDQFLKSLETVSAGHYGQGIKGLRYREFQVIADQLDHMSSQVLAREESLRSSNQRLENEIAERRRAEEALRQSQERYRDLFDNISDFICTHDLRGRLLTINRMGAQFLGRTSQELVGRCLADFMLPKYRQDFFGQYLPAIMRQEHLEGVSSYMGVDGRLHYVEYRNQLIKPPEGEAFVSCSGRDITQRLAAERELRMLQEELAQARKMEAVGTLASGIAHDFNNILQVISGAVHLCRGQGGLAESTLTYLGEIGLAVERASDLVARLLTFGHKGGAELKPLDLARLVPETVKMLGRTLPKMIDIQVELAPGLRLVPADPGQMEQMLMNLAANAKDAMPQGGRLAIEVVNQDLDDRFCQTHKELRPGPHVRLMVSDSGQGMDQATQQRIFEPFFTTKGIGEGTGLGLSTVYGIVTAHGGGIYCHSQPGQGTTFEIFLPALTDQASAEVLAEPQGPALPAGGETILLVDDEPAIVATAKEYLEYLGYRVLTAESGEQALERHGTRPQGLSLIVLDLGMPGMGGLAFLRRLRESGATVRVVVATGFLSDSDHDELSALGVMEFLSKPYPLDQLAQKVRLALDAPA